MVATQTLHPLPTNKTMQAEVTMLSLSVSWFPGGFDDG